LRARFANSFAVYSRLGRSVRWQVTSARGWLGAILVLQTVAGSMVGMVADGSAGHERTILIVAAFPLYVFTYLWMKTDSQQRSTVPPPGAIPLVVLALPVAAAYYLLGTRRGWHKLTALARFAAFVVLCALLFGTASSAGHALAT